MEPTYNSLTATSAAWPRERVLRWTVWAYAATITVAVLVTPALFLVRVLASPFDRRQRFVGELYRRAVALTVALNPLWRVRLEPSTPPALPEASVVVANHVSLADMFLLKHLPWPELKTLAKWEIFAIPFVGWNMWLVGDVSIRRGRPASARRAMRRCAEWLRAGASVLVFPEGTRSQSRSLGPFKDGAFRLAIEHQRPVVPVVLLGAHNAVPGRSWRIGRADAVVRALPPIETAGMTLDDVPQLKARVRAAMLDAMGQHAD